MRHLEQKVNRLMNRRYFKHWLFLPFLLTGALLTAQTPPVVVTLSYAPGAGAAFDVVEIQTRETGTGAQRVTDVRRRESVMRVAAATERESTAFSNTVTIVSQSLTRNGQVIASPLHAALGGLELTYHLGTNGNLLEIEGYEGLGDAMAGKLPDGLAATLQKLVSQDTLRHQDRTSYEEVYGPFTAGSITPVANQVSAASHALPNEGSVVLYSVLTIAVRSDDDKIELTRIFDSDAAALAMRIEGLEEATITAAAGTLVSMLPSTYASARVSGREIVLVQPSGSVLVESRSFDLSSEWTLRAAEGTDPPTFRVSDSKMFTVTPVEPPDSATTTQP